MNMGIVDHSSYYTIQDTHCMDTIKECWNEKRAEIVQSLQDRDVAIMTDGGMDSPGHCAQYCTYTTMENESRAILSIITGLKESGLRCSSQRGDVIGVHGGGVVAMVAAGSMVTSSVCSMRRVGVRPLVSSASASSLSGSSSPSSAATSFTRTCTLSSLCHSSSGSSSPYYASSTRTRTCPLSSLCCSSSPSFCTTWTCTLFSSSSLCHSSFSSSSPPFASCGTGT
ncbi:uncharacterized protein LOC122965488 [Thunnus albacares]|uniref:uncharacterized protein LOC122965488 n=1 Tax=Thunnus albacares TaxID=8236 RepID=UPI001CF61108|nr:uncharacterized protein LOC122965488 [Thunnus albacares]